MSSQFLILMVIANLYGYYYVDGASCTTSSTCQQTDYTLSTCTSGVCNCINSSFTAIRTGCALKLDKPVISSGIYSNQVISGQAFTLTCVLPDAATFEWFKDTVKIVSATTGTYTATASAATEVGSFTCKGKTLDTLLSSEESDAFKVEMLGGTGGLTTSAVQPKIVVPTTTAIANSVFNLDCYNIPMGSVTADVTYKVAGSSSTKSVTITSGNAGNAVTCTIANPSGVTMSKAESDAGKLPTLITNIESVTVTYNYKELTDVGINTDISLQCTYAPAITYLGAPTPTVTYAWLKDNSAITGETNPTYTTNAAGTYSCSAKLGSLDAKSSSNKVTVTERNDQLQISASQPIKGGRVILTCGDVRYDGATYSWLKGGTQIDRQFDRRLQIDNVDTVDDAIYSCSVIINGAILDTFTRSFTTQTTINTPTISVTGCGSGLGEKGDYYLKCYTTSETLGMTYEWTAKGVVSTTVTGKYYSLPAISTSHNGDYTCKAKFGSVTSAASNTKTVEVTPPGMRCYNDNTCVATGYSGKCDLNDRCLCADGYTQKGEVCSGGILSVVSSSIIIAVAYLVSRIL